MEYMLSGGVLRRTQKNEVLELLLDAGLDPSEFAWEQRTYSSGSYIGPADLLVHGATGYFFEFMLRGGSNHYGRMSPAVAALEGTEAASSWTEQLRHVHRWASDVRMELEAPDLWSSVHTWRALAEQPPIFHENLPFSAAELVQLDERLDVIGNRLTDLVDQGDLRSLAEHLVDHLRQESRRQGRRNWFFLALGALISFMVNAAFDPQRAREMVNLLVEGVRSIGSG